MAWKEKVMKTGKISKNGKVHRISCINVTDSAPYCKLEAYGSFDAHGQNYSSFEAIDQKEGSINDITCKQCLKSLKGKKDESSS